MRTAGPGPRAAPPGHEVAEVVGLEGQPAGRGLLAEPGGELALGGVNGWRKYPPDGRASARTGGSPGRPTSVLDDRSRGSIRDPILAMEFQDVVRRRRMVRDYSDEPVDPAVIDRALANAVRAPSAGFSQGWAFLVLDTPDDGAPVLGRPPTRRPRRARQLAGRDDARAVVIVSRAPARPPTCERYAQDDKGWTDQDEARWPVPFWHMDTAMASLLILQTATDAGLGACFFGVPPDKDAPVREAFGIPDDHDPVGVITIGHRAPTDERARLAAHPAPQAPGRAGPPRSLGLAARLSPSAVAPRGQRDLQVRSGRMRDW